VPEAVRLRSDWRKETIPLSAGTWILQWKAYADHGSGYGTNTLWVDDVNFVPGDPACWIEAQGRTYPTYPADFCLLLCGEPGQTFELEASDNLQNWWPLSRLDFIGYTYWFAERDHDAPARFYRLHKLNVAPSTSVWFELPVRTPDGTLQLTLHSAPGRPLEIQRSTNLLSWASLTILTNNPGTLKWTDATPVNSAASFYRARAVR